MEEQQAISAEPSSKACYIRLAESLSTFLVSIKETGRQIIDNSDSSTVDEKKACFEVTLNALAMYDIVIGQLTSLFDKDQTIPTELQSILDECKRVRDEAEVNVVKLKEHLVNCKVLRLDDLPKLFTEKARDLNEAESNGVPATNETVQFAKTDAASQFMQKYVNNFHEWAAALTSPPTTEDEIASYMSNLDALHKKYS